jgi:MFS transporter, YQGE family, putative transporter
MQQEIPTHNTYYSKELFTRELFEMYFLLGIRKFAISMVGIFLPLYFLIELHYSLNAVIAFYMINVIAVVAFLWPAMKIVKIYGTKHSIIYSIPTLIIGLLLAVMLPNYPFLFIPISILLGIDLALFWMGFHTDTAIYSKSRALGKESAIIWIVNVFGMVLGPIVGGVILKYLGFSVLFFTVSIILIIAIIPLLFSKETYAKTEFDWKYFFHDGHKKYFFGYFAQGIRSITTIIFWPIFIFGIIGGYFYLGVYGSVATLLVALFGYSIGQISDKMNKGIIIKIAGIADGMLWVIKIFITTILDVFAFGTIGGITAIGIDIPLLAKSYKKAKNEKIAAFILFREFSIRCGQMFVLIVVLVIGNIKASFITSALAGLLYLFF